MRVAALYDIHGNLPALEAVLADIRRAEVDRVVVGGDVLPGPMPRESLDRLLALDIPVDFIYGNGERAVLAEMMGEVPAVPERVREVIRWTAEQITPEHQRTLASWPLTRRIAIPGLGDVLFCHATPRSDTEIFTHRTPDERVTSLFDGIDASIVVCGHTHMQFDRTIGALRIVNAGSVGMPFGEPVAYWLLLGPDVQLQRTAYDLVDAAARIRATRYPEAREFAERDVLHPLSEADALARLEPTESR